MINKMELVKELRALTQAGMNDCKSALEECEWDLQKAIDAVKAKGLNNTTRNAGKIAAEGVIDIFVKDGVGATMVEVNCQTDFVAKSETFLKFTGDVTASLGTLSFEDLCNLHVSPAVSFEDARKEVMASTKENVVVRRWARFESGPGVRVFSYLHSNARLGVLVKLQSPTEESAGVSTFMQLGEEIAMQVAAMAPLAVSRDQISEDEKNRQKNIFETQLTEAKKPQAAWPKIMEGKFNKWYTDVCLLDQESVVVPKMSVNDLVKKLSHSFGGEIRVLEFVRFAVGEGIEVKIENYGDEIAKLTGLENELVPRVTTTHDEDGTVRQTVLITNKQ